MEIRLELDKIDRARKELRESRSQQIDDEKAYEEINGTLTYLNNKETKLRNELKGNNGVPNAPFKKNWHELMVKQALDMAAKGDYDAIAFTTGKQQAERYSLAKHIDKLVYNETTKSLFGYNEKGNVIVNKSDVSPDQLADYIGQETAQKMLDKEYENITTKGAEHYKIKRLENADLHIGGEGMKGFYDKILPDYINKYTKKWGMGMKKANLEHTNLRADLSDEELLKGLEKIGMDSRKYYQLPISERSEIYQKISNEFYPREKNQVHFVELSDAAKKDIKEKGQPLFAGLGAIAGADYMEGLDEQNKTGIFKDLKKHKKH